MKLFIKRFLCTHGPWSLLVIGWDGISTLECQKCGKIKKASIDGKL